MQPAPIVVLLAGDPVKIGLTTSWNRPEGNITGVSLMQVKLAQKQLEFLNEVVPPAAPIGVLIDTNSDSADNENSTRAAAAALHRAIVFADAENEESFAPALHSLAQRGVGGVTVTGGALFTTHHQQLAALIAQHALPAIFANGDLASSGGLMKYGADLPSTFRQLGHYVGKILSGAKPADLPFERPERIELQINLKTAKALGIAFPPAVLARADVVIE